MNGSGFLCSRIYFEIRYIKDLCFDSAMRKSRMSNAQANINIRLVQNAIFAGDSITLIKEFEGGLKAYANASGSAVGIFAELDEGDLFNVSGWHKHPSKTLEEIADGLHD